MDRDVLIALGIVIAGIGLYFLIKSKPKTSTQQKTPQATIVNINVS